MSFQRRSIFGSILPLLIASIAWTGPAGAQDKWPSKPVRIIVPFSAGGSTDVLARLVGQKLTVLWGQPVVIENKGGAGGNVGADAAAKSPADGYTLLMASGSIAINPSIYKKMPFDTKKDLAPITNVAGGPMMVVVPDRSPAKTLKDLIDMAKQKPGKLNFGSAGVGSQVHLAGENFANATGISITHVPYKGEAAGYNDLVAGQIDLMVGNFAGASALLGPGRLRALAVTSKGRTVQLPDIPTVAESGYPGFENTGWFGLLAPAGTPTDIIAKVQRDTATVMADTETKARLFVQGMTPIANSPAEFAATIDEEMQRWSTVVKNRNIRTN